MTSTVIDVYKEFVLRFDQYWQQGDIVSAVRVAKKIVEYADDQCLSAHVSQSYKEYYQASSAKARQFLADMNRERESATLKSQNNEKTEQAVDWFSADIPHLTMRDVAGLEDVQKEFLVNVFAPLSPKYAPIYKKYRRELGLQILLYGPPGTGKTHIVKCLAGSLGCKIAVVQIKDVMANLVGDGAKIISEIFEQAKKYDKCIIFFDEIDAIAANREDDESRYTKEQLTTLLTNMDGFTSGTKPNQIRIVVAATNRPWILDNAIKRGGRFDTQVYVPLPDFDARKKLVELALGKDKKVKNRVDCPCAPDVTVEWLANKFDGYSGADIKAVCKQIVNRPLRREIEYLRDHNIRKDDCITRSDCEEVFKKYINSITDEMLFSYDAYRANMDLADYLKIYEPKARACRASGEKLPAHVVRWLKRIDETAV